MTQTNPPSKLFPDAQAPDAQTSSPGTPSPGIPSAQTASPGTQNPQISNAESLRSAASSVPSPSSSPSLPLAGPPVAPSRPAQLVRPEPRPADPSWARSFESPNAPPAGPSPAPPAGPLSARYAPPQLPPPAASPARPVAQPPRRRRTVAAAVGSFLLGGAVGIGGFAAGQAANDAPETEPTVITAAAPAPEATERSSGLTTTTPTIVGDEPIAVVARAVGPSVVQVETDRGQGSGVVYEDGLILTNHHVVEGADSVQVRSDDGRVFSVEVLGSDPRNDIAVLSAPGADLPVAAIGASAELEVGQLTVAIGSPFQLQQTVTSGIVSSLNRPVPNQTGSFSAMVQTDAPINPGNSGGALANRAGEVVGINASIRTDGTSNSNVGIGFAIPIDTAIGVAERIVSGQSLEPGVLGVSGDSQDDGIGVPIAEVTPGSAAATAGLQAGDRVLTIDGAPVTNIGEVVGLVQSNFGGDVVDLQVLRDGVNLEVQATLD